MPLASLSGAVLEGILLSELAADMTSVAFTYPLEGFPAPPPNLTTHENIVQVFRLKTFVDALL